jgi:hypothetical protein
MSTHTAAHDAGKYYVPHGSHWPIVGSIGCSILMWGAVALLNEWGPGWVMLPGGLMHCVPVRRLVPHHHRREPGGHVQPATSTSRSAWE